MDSGANDSLEVLFGSKGPAPRTLYYEPNGRSDSLAEERPTAYEWIQLPLGQLAGGQPVLLFGKGRVNVAFLAGVRLRGRPAGELKVKPIPIGQAYAAVWADLPGFEMSREARQLWDAFPGEPDWARAERSAHYAGAALDKVQRW